MRAARLDVQTGSVSPNYSVLPVNSVRSATATSTHVVSSEGMRTLIIVVTLGLTACTPPGLLDDGGVELFDSGVASADAGVDAGIARCGEGTMPADGVVVTTSGAVSGLAQGDVFAFMGIPYVRPPVGALRWRAPEPMTCWQGVRPAIAPGPVCPQLKGDAGVVGEEDCLTVNVFAKRGAQAAPVMVWIHGGGNTTGSGSDDLFDGRDLASKRGVVVVTMNYRLGALGYLVHAGLNAENDAGVSGNYGILDQQAALRWVRDNARAFGGDPSKVLLFGESAGGQNTMLHLVAPGSKGLFSAAIAESGGLYGTTLAEAQTSLQSVVTSVGCGTAADQLTCLRSASVATLAGLSGALSPLDRGTRYSPVTDGVVLPADPLALVRQGKQHGVPVILGTNSDETSRMVANVTTDAEYQAAVRAQYGMMRGNLALAQYPSSRFTSPRAALVALTTDATWTCPIRRFARALTSTQQAPVYRYFFTWRSSGPAGNIVGATHGLDVPFVFRSFSAISNFTPDANAQALSDAMQGYWSSFAATGTPTGSVAWPRFPVNGDSALELNTTITPLANLRGADCDFIDSLAP